MIKQNIYNEFVRIANQVYAESKANEKDLHELKHKPHLFVLFCVMNRQIKYGQAWNIPRIIADIIGDDSLEAFSSQSLEYYSSLFQERSLHRYNNTIIPRVFYLAVKRIESQYDLDANNIWSDNPSSAELVYRFLEFDGVGIKIATMAANILAREYEIPLKDKYSIDISPDIHIKRIFYRMGLIVNNKDIPFSKIDETKIIYKAREINPEFPGILDLLCWQIGNQSICTNSICKCNECKLNTICAKIGVAT